MTHHPFAAHALKEFETDAHWQFQFHLWAMAFWVLNLLAGTVVMILLPHFWLQIGVFYVFALSIYANWTSDYTAVAAAMAAMHGEDILTEMAERAAEVAEDKGAVGHG